MLPVVILGLALSILATSAIMLATLFDVALRRPANNQPCGAKAHRTQAGDRAA